MSQPNKKNDHVIVVLTDRQGQTASHIDQLQDAFGDLVGDAIEMIEVITTFEMEGGDRNIIDVIEEVQEAVQKKLEESPESALEDFAASSGQCVVDEHENYHCKEGKESAGDILSAMQAVDISTRKQTLLPQQGDNLYRLGTLLRKLHRNQGKEIPYSRCESIKMSIKDIREGQLKASSENIFMDKVVSMFHNPPETKSFAVRWLQREIDAMSLSNLSQLQNDKNEKSNELRTARSGKKDLQRQISQLEKEIAGVTLGMEHLFREMAQLYEVTSELKQETRANVNSLPDITSHHLLEGHPVEIDGWRSWICAY